MASTSHSAAFNSAQMATDQREGPEGSSPQTVSSFSLGSYQANLSPHNPCTVENWARYTTQPSLMLSPQYSQHCSPHVMGTELYKLPLSHQNLTPDHNSYMDAYYSSSHVNPNMDSPTMGLVEIKEEFLQDGDSDWKPFKFTSPEGDEYYQSAHYAVPQLSQSSPPSPPSTISSSYPPSQSFTADSPARTVQTFDTQSLGRSSENGKACFDGLPYSRLIYCALDSAEGKKLSLQGIYRWFEHNTNKPYQDTNKREDKPHKGWQNSIRHNLSMNAGFEAVKEDMGPGKKAVNFWRLTAESIKQKGIQSTTRYRKEGKGPSHGSQRGPQRGPKRRPSESRGPSSKKLKTCNATNASSQQVQLFGHESLSTELPPMAFMHPSFGSGLPNGNNTVSGFGMGPVSGCTAQFPGAHGGFIGSPEMEQEVTAGFTMEHAWYAPSSGPNNRAIIGSNAPAYPMLDCKEQ